MMVQALISLATVALLAARAVNITRKPTHGSDATIPCNDDMQNPDSLLVRDDWERHHDVATEGGLVTRPKMLEPCPMPGPRGGIEPPQAFQDGTPPMSGD